MADLDDLYIILACMMEMACLLVPLVLYIWYGIARNVDD
jgi:hypothetical protein